MPFEAMCQHLVQNQFTSDAFQGDSDSYLFQWDTNVWESWPDVDGQNFKEDWDKEGHINHPKRSDTALTTEDIHQLQQDTPAHNELRAPMNQFMERQFANQEPLRNNLLIPTLEARIKLPSSEGILHKWFIPSLATSQSGTQIKLWNSSSFAVRAT